ncbi:catalase HPII [Halomonas sp. WWR20]
MVKKTHTTNTDGAHDTDFKTHENSKVDGLNQYRSDATGHDLRTNQGVRIADNQNSLKAGARGPTLLEDFIFREKLNHFDHERIPERIVHARGSGAHGYFQPYKNAAQYSKAGLFQDPNKKTPTFVRFSTVQGPRGSNDTVRDVRGFATKFYTDEGNWDLVANNMPVFFIQDAIKFPDFVHAVKPEPHNEIPQGQSAHDTFWDFVSLVPESTHMVLWTMSDRAFPRSYRSMEGFGVHTFRMIDKQGKSRFVKFHWKPLSGTYSLLWDEAHKLWGDPDYNRRDLWNDIENGDFPEFEFGIQVIEEEDEHSFDFDILDPTKIIPEEQVPVIPIGKMVLNRNPDNFFAETEQVAFCPAHIVPGIDFTNDPLLQGRLFSYNDTQMLRLGGPNFHEIPINQPVCPTHNNQRDALHRQTINTGQASYEPNSIDDGWPRETPSAPENGGFESHYERVDAHKVRERSDSFMDHFSQATLFWNSQSEVEKEHIIEAYTFELSKVMRPWIRERVVQQILVNIHPELARRVGENHGIEVPDQPTATAEQLGRSSCQDSPALSLIRARKPNGIKSRKVAILIAEGVDADHVEAIQRKLKAEGAMGMLIAPSMAPVKTPSGTMLTPDEMLEGQPSFTMDAVIVPGGAQGVKALCDSGQGRHYVLEAYKHLKVIGTLGEGQDLLAAANLPTSEEGVINGARPDDMFAGFVNALSEHRIWSRSPKVASIPA